MTTQSFDDIAEALEHVARREAFGRPTEPGYFQLVVTDAEQPFLVRWWAGNDEQIWRTSENYVQLDDAVHAIALLPGGREWLKSYTPHLVDERSAS